MKNTFLEKLQDIPRQAERVRESFGSEDRPNPTASRHFAERGYRSVKESGRDWNRRVMKCAEFMADIATGRRDIWQFREAMTTADFPNLFGDVLYRQLLGNYVPWPVTYPAYMRIMDAPDFRVMHMYTIDGGQGLLGKPSLADNDGNQTIVPLDENEAYPETKFVETPYTVRVAKYGRRYGISWEMIKNDDLNAFAQRPMMMATGARRSEEFLAMTMMFDANGPHATFFTVANNNIIGRGANAVGGANPKLTFQGLQCAYAQLAKQRDKDNQPIMINTVNLVVPPALETTAQNILKAHDLRIQLAPGGGNTPPTGADLGTYAYVENWMSKRTRLSVAPYAPYVAKTANGDTSWMLVADPNDMTQRPAFVFAFLRGYRQPQLFYKDPDARPLGGGSPDVLDGNFDIDGIDYKLRHVFGAAQVDPKMAIASNGTEVDA